MVSLFLLLSLLFECFIHLQGAATVIEIPGDNNNTLDQYLCQTASIPPDTVLVLQSYVSHYISPVTTIDEAICLVSNTSQITIKASDALATVVCIGTYLATRRGIAFHNVTNLTISNVLFEGCGGILTDSVMFLNSSSRVESQFYFTSYQSAALIFDTCSNLQLSVIEITEYEGFGMILSDSYGNILIQNLTITGQLLNETVKHGGSGLLIHYRKQLNRNNNSSSIPTATISVFNCIIKDGYYDNRGGQLVDIVNYMMVGLYTSNEPSAPIIGGGGLSVILREAQSNIVNLVFDDTYIVNNTALQAGGITIFFIDIDLSSIMMNNLISENNCVVDNVNHYNVIGRSLMVYFFFFELPLANEINANSLNIYNGRIGGKDLPVRCQDAENLGSYTEVLIIQAPQVVKAYTVTINGVVFESMSGSPNRGAALALYASSMNKAMNQAGLGIVLTNVNASDFSCTVSNSKWSCHNVGLFAFSNVLYALIKGGLFLNNKGSSVITSVNSRIFLTGNVTFDHNEAQSYGAISLRDAAILYFFEPLHAIFMKNRGLLGAAIYAVAESNAESCSIQYLPKHYYDISNYTNMSIIIEMIDNKAELAGNALYASPIKFCELYSQQLEPSIKNLSLLIESTFKLGNQNDDGIQDISSIATQICNCNVTPTSCQSNYTYISATAHPGQQLNFSIAAFDIGQTVSVYSLVTAQFYSHGIFGVTSLSLAPNEVITKIPANKCSILNYTIFHSINASQRSYPIPNVLLTIGPYTETPRYTVNITLVACPHGFYSARSTCKCIYHDFAGLSCNFQEGSVDRPANSWIGHLSSDTKVFGFSSQCPPSYCLSEVHEVSFADSSRGVCYGNRSGTLCGDCPDGLSVVFGTAECLKCSNAYLATILLYAGAGIGLVFLLFFLQLTLTTGTINGLIFYANIVGSTDGYLFGQDTSYEFLRVFIALINLELGFPLCFYDGMNELVLRCLQFAFPLYLWFIVILIIILSRYSRRLAKITGRQSVQVLATLIYLSSSKIFLTTINIMTSATVKTSNHKELLVWYFYGRLEFGKGLHLISMILSLFMIGVFIIPFTALTTLSPFLNRFRLINRYMPLTDAVFAPYKIKWRFWFGARLCLLAAAYISAAVLRGTNVKLLLGIQLVLVLGFSFVQSFFHPFKNKVIEGLDLFFMLNYSLIAFFVVYTQDSGTMLQHSSAVLVSIAMIVALCIIAYHCYISCKIYCKIKKDDHLLLKGHTINNNNNYGAADGEGDIKDLPEVHSGYAKYREPLNLLTSN